MRRLELRYVFLQRERQKLVKSPPPLKDALTFPAETLVHVAAELPFGLHLWKALFKSFNLPCG